MFNGYRDSQIHGVVGYGGKLNIRSKFQREFVYKDAQSDAVIDTVMKNPQSRMIGIVAINVYNNEKIEFKSYAEAEKHGYYYNSIKRCIDGKQESYKNYKWKLKTN